MEQLKVKTADIVNGELWKLFPCINVDKVKDIPIDYPGPIGVPITFLDKIGRNDGSSGFLIIDTWKPRLMNGKEVYQRLIIRNLQPALPEEIDLIEWLRKTGTELEIELRYNKEM